MLLGGGVVTNQAGATISAGNGVYGYGGTLTLTNAGAIKGSVYQGVFFYGAATIQNQAGGSITGNDVGVYVVGGAASVTNAGVITGGTASVVLDGAGANTLTLQTGSVLNGAAVGSTAAGATNTLILQGSGEADNNFVNFNTLIAEGPGTWTLGGTSAFTTAQLTGGTLDVTGSLNDVNAGIEITSSSATLINSGTISSPNDGVLMDQGGSFTNQKGGVLLSGTTGVYAKGGPGYVNNAGAITGGVGVLLTAGGSVTNSGNILGTAGTGFGVLLTAGGNVTNAVGGYIHATGAGGDGVVITTDSGNVTNSGVILSTTKYGVVLMAGGTVINNAGAYITSSHDGVVIEGASGNITNAGTIKDFSAASTDVAVGLLNGGAITNLAGGNLTGNTGAYGKIAITVTNAGTITGFGDPGVSLSGGGTVNNEAGGVITGANSGVYAKGAAAMVTNAGAIAGTSTDGVLLIAGGAVANQTGGKITGGVYGVRITGGAASVTNAGSISAVGTGVGLASTTASLDNWGSIVATSAFGLGVLMTAGGSATNESGGYIGGGGAGVEITGGAATLTNSGTIHSVSFSGAVVMGSGQVTNNAGAVISGGYIGLDSVGVNVTNAGTISTKAVGYGAALLAVGGVAVSNQAGGVISGATGVYAYGGSVTLTNAGAITGVGANGVSALEGATIQNAAAGVITGKNIGVYVYGGAGVTNAGAIGGGTDSIVFAGVGANTLTLQTGSALTGDVVGSTAAGATNALVLQGGGEADNTFLNFGSLVAQGPGTWTLGGTAAITTTEVAGGTLIVTGALTTAFTIDKGATLEGAVANLLAQGAVVDNGSLVFSQATNATFANNISGTGAIDKQGAGVLMLGGTDNVSSTEVAGGALIVTGSLTSAFKIDNGATLQGAAANLLGAVADNGTLVFAQPTNGTFANNISGTGALIKAGAGALTLGGTDAVGSTEVAAGSLIVTGSLASAIQIDSGATLQSGNSNLAGAIVDNGALIFADTGNGTFAGSLTGSGKLVAAGPGALTLSGTFSLPTTEVAGGTLIVAGALTTAFTIDAGGTLEGGSGNLLAQGTLADNGTLIFNQTASAAFGNDIVGSGAIVKQGAGLLALDGVSSVATTTVDAGNLQIGDAGHTGAQLTSAVTVNAGGTLSGHGTIVGAVTNDGGVVSPGGTVGVLTINGAYTQAPTGTLAIEMTPSASSELKVTGAASLAGTLLFEADAGVYRKGQVYDFLSAGSITGAFSTIAFEGPAIFSVSQQGDSLLATTTVGNFALQGGTANQRSIVAAFNNYPAGVSDFDAVANAIIDMAAGPAQNLAINELGSEASPDLIGASRGSVRNLLGDLTSQLSARPAASGGGANDPFWIEGVGRFGSTQSDGNAHGFSDTTGGIAGGAQRDFGAATLGGAVSYERTSLTLSGLPQSGDVADTSLGLYGEERFGTMFADVAGVVGFDHGSEKRFITAPGISRQASGSFNGLSSGVLAQLGDRFALSGGWALEPRIGVSWSHVDQNGFTESGAGGADLAIAGESQDAVQSLVGARVTKAFSGALSGEASFDWAHDFNDLTPRAAESFAAAPGTGFAIDGVNPGRDAALVRAGLDYRTSRVTFFARYDGSFSSRADDNQVTGGLRIAF